ncbi:MAG: GIY-YIG nuclease family protein [Pedosphaera sp.]|nr:GIY-YIG nuclease family protein [Pedosphaera sp.]
MCNESQDKKPVQLIRLAEELKLSPASMKKFVVRRGIKPFQIHKGQSKLFFISAEDADKLRKRIENHILNIVSPLDQKTEPNSSGVYLIEVPSYDGINRIRIGWADNFEERLSFYRTIVPDLKVRVIWYTLDKWTERMAHKRASELGNRIHTELFTFDDTERAIEQIKEVFSMIGISYEHYDK